LFFFQQLLWIWSIVLSLLWLSQLLHRCFISLTAVGLSTATSVLYMLANFGNPVTILAASCCICSILFKSKIVQPSHSSHAYSNIGLIGKHWSLTSTARVILPVRSIDLVDEWVYDGKIKVLSLSRKKRVLLWPY
jgi:hypothetical protein